MADLFRALGPGGLTVPALYGHVTRLRQRRFLVLERPGRALARANGRPATRLCVTPLGREALAGFLRIGPATRTR